MKKGSKHSAEALLKISMAKKGVPNLKRRGYKYTPDQIKRLSESHKGLKPTEGQLSTLLFYATGENNSNWMGDKVSYHALHHWVRRHLGHPTSCSQCKSPEVSVKRTNIQWANRSKKYLRDKSDWVALCVSCHKAYDSGKIELTTV